MNERSEPNRANRGGRPRLLVDADTVLRLRSEGQSWRAISLEVGVGCGTVRRAFQRLATTLQKPIPEAAATSPKLPEMPPAPGPKVFGFARTRHSQKFRCGKL